MSYLPRVLLAQLLAFAILWWLVVPQFAIAALPALLLQGGVAALLGLVLRLPRWWLSINLLLPLTLISLLALELPPWLYLLGFALLLLVQWNSAGERVPLYLSNRHTWQALAEQLPAGRPFHFVDLGSGLGGTLCYLAGKYPQGQFSGIESAPLPYALAWLRCKLARRKNIRLHYGSIWDARLKDYDLIYAFLSPAPMARLEQKWQSEQRAGATLISNSFAMPSASPKEILELNDRRHTRLYLYTSQGSTSPRSKV